MEIDNSNPYPGVHPILTGAPEDGENNWVTRFERDPLIALTKVVNKKMPLTLPDGYPFTVIFDRQDGPPIQALQVLPLTNSDDSDFYVVVIRLQTAAPDQ